MKFILMLNTPRDGYAQYMSWPGEAQLPAAARGAAERNAVRPDGSPAAGRNWRPPARPAGRPPRTSAGRPAGFSGSSWRGRIHRLSAGQFLSSFFVDGTQRRSGLTTVKYWAPNWLCTRTSRLLKRW